MTHQNRLSRPDTSHKPRLRAAGVAIVGLACKFAGAADAAAYWRNTLAARDSTGEPPADRRDPNRPLPRGGFLNAELTFDAARHGLTPDDVQAGDPEQFLVLDAAVAALEDAGLEGGVPRTARVEVVIGRENDTGRGRHGRVLSETLAVLQALHPDWSEAEFDAIRDELTAGLPTTDAHATAGRVSERLNLSGASYVVDAGGASALLALDLGMRALTDRRADLAVVGAIHLIHNPGNEHVGWAPPTFPKSVGGAYPTQNKTGTRMTRNPDVPEGEGVGVVVLKRLADADRDGDRVYAVIKAVGLAGDGRTPARGLTRALRRAYRRAGIDPATVGLVESQRSGIPADRAESRALKAVFPAPEKARGERSLAAASSTIGHASHAAGLAGLISAALALHHRTLPPTIRGNAPHPPGFAHNTAARPWINGGTAGPRRAGVNAFQPAGLSAHAVLEEHSPSADGVAPGLMNEWDTEAILLGASDRDGLIALGRALLGWLETADNASVPLKDLAATLNLGQRPFAARLGLVVRSTSELVDRLKSTLGRLSDPKCRAVRDARGTYFWQDPLGTSPGSVAFLFPGEGSQYPGMLADLCPHFPELRQVLDTSDRIAAERGHQHLPSEQLFGAAENAGEGLWGVGTAVNVVLSSQWALYQLVSRLGLRPDVVVGHSSGEILALAAAGVFRVDQNLEARLGELGSVFEGLEAAGRVPAARLWAVAADRATVIAVCEEAGLDPAASVAIDNCPHQVVVAAPPDESDSLVAVLRRRGLMHEELPFRRAYHTDRFAPALGPLRAFYQSLHLRPASRPVYSCASASAMPADVEGVRSLATDQWVRPVNFRATVEAMHADGVRVFVEIGARGSLTGYVEDTLRGLPHFAVAANLPRRSGTEQLNHAVASLYAQGLPVVPDLLYARRRPRRVEFDRNFKTPATAPRLAVENPALRLSQAVARRVRSTPADSPTRPVTDNPPTSDVRPEASGLLSYFATMDAFLATQRDVMAAYLQARPASPDAGPPATAVPIGVPGLEPVGWAPPPSHEPVGGAHTTDDKTGNSDDASDAARTALLELVAKRTGYPIEILGLDQDMEADLGIDSIKRVEILTDWQDLGHAPGELDPERLQRCRTLGQIIRLVETPAAATSPTPGPWSGTVRTFHPGRELVGALTLDPDHDPVARHHTLGGRRISEVDPGRLGLPVLPFTVMAEMLAQAASAVVGKVVVALREVHAHRWIPYRDDEGRPTRLEVRATRDAERPDEVRVVIQTPGNPPRDAVSGVVVFADRRPDAPEAPAFTLPEPDLCRFTAAALYGDQWLFHGPALQAVTHVGPASRGGIEGTLRVLPRRALLPESSWPVLHTDPIVLDAFTHLLGAWGLDGRAGREGELMFPLNVGEIRIHGDDPAEGAEVSCRIRVGEVTRHRVRAEADIVRPDGRIWVSIRDWEDWRFYWPTRYRDVFRDPARFFVGEPVPLGNEAGADAVAVWLEPPADMARPVWGDVLDWVQLAPEERDKLRAGGASKSEIWAVIAAKEAARRSSLARGGRSVYPADLRIERDAEGRIAVRHVADPEFRAFVSLAYAEGAAVAVAWPEGESRVGLAVLRAESEADLPAARRECGRRAEADLLGDRGDDPADAAAVRVERRGDFVWAWAAAGARIGASRT